MTITTADQYSLDERLARLFAALSIQRAHVGGGYAAQAIELTLARPELVASLALVCPSGFDAEPLRALGSRVLYIHGDRGPNATNAARVGTALTQATCVTLMEYTDTLWCDPAADRVDEVGSAMLAFLDAQEGIRDASLAEGEGEHAGVRYRVRGSGPPLVLMPLNLARSQWERLVPVLAERYCTISVGGAFLGFVPLLEDRMRGGYSAVVRAVMHSVDPRPGESILEVGCGSGAVARWLARHTADANPIMAVDVNSYLLAEAQSLTDAAGFASRIVFREGDAHALPLPDTSVDVCLAFTVMEEVNADRLLGEMTRVTRPGGRIAVIVRGTDMRYWTNLRLRRELIARLEVAASGGAAEHGCADASLYDRFRAAGLRDLQMGPQLATHTPAQGAEFLGLFSRRLRQNLAPDEAAECEPVLRRAVDDGTLMWADPYHCAVGTRP